MKVLSKVGFVLMILGAAGIESENMAVPAVIALVGSAIIGISVLKENSLV